MIKPLPNPKCLPEILRRINKARRSIVAVNYIAEFSTRNDLIIVRASPAVGRSDYNIVRASPAVDRGESRTDPVLILAQALVHAHKRGVKVSVILEGSRLKDNYPFYRFLKDRGVDVWLDTSQTLIHHKAILADDKILIIGSHNWSTAAFFKNEEFSIITNDKATIKSFQHELKKITKQREEVRSNVSRDCIHLPIDFVRKVACPLYRAHAELAFNLYMILCLEDNGTPRPISIANEKWGRALGFDPTKAGKRVSANYLKYYYAHRLNRVLSQLKRFLLIEVDRRSDVVIRRTLSRSKGRIEIPKAFWNFGWQERLLFSAKVFYIVSLAEEADSPFHPWWSRSMSEIRRSYGLAPTVREGIHELENYNILEILRSIPVKRGRFYSQEAHYYRLNPFYDMRQWCKRLSQLEREFSKETVRRSQRIAAAFWATHNLDAIKTISALIRRIGYPKVMRAGIRISKLPAFSSRRCLDYLVELVLT